MRKRAVSGTSRGDIARRDRRGLSFYTDCWSYGTSKAGVRSCGGLYESERFKTCLRTSGEVPLQ